MPNTVILKGNPVPKEAKCSAAITPGHLLEFASDDTLQLHSSSGGVATPLFAVEEDYVGNPVTEAYTSGDRVPYAACRQGDEVWAHLASGQNVAKGSYLMSDGAGLLTAHTGTNYAVAMAAEDADASAGDLRFRAEVV